MSHQPKISTVEAFVLVIVAIIADVLSLIPIINWLVWLGMSAVMLYLKFIKGILPASNLIAFLIEFIPGLSALPLYTIGMIATIIIDRRPEGALARAAQKAAQVTATKRPIAKTGVVLKAPVGGLQKA